MCRLGRLLRKYDYRRSKKRRWSTRVKETRERNERPSRPRRQDHEDKSIGNVILIDWKHSDGKFLFFSSRLKKGENRGKEMSRYNYYEYRRWWS